MTVTFKGQYTVSWREESPGVEGHKSRSGKVLAEDSNGNLFVRPEHLKKRVIMVRRESLL